MKKFLLGILAGIVIAVVSGIVILFASMKFAGSAPTIPDKVCLVVGIEGAVPEAAPPTLPLPAFESRSPVTVLEYHRVMRDAARDPRVGGVLLKPRGAGASWGKLDELRAGIAEIQKAGKPVYAWLESPGMREYYLAAGADQIFLAPEDLLNVKGLRLEAMYFKGTLDKIGVQMEIEHAGKYKDAGDIFSRSSMSPETRESLNSILDELFPKLMEGIASGRKKSPDQVKALIDQGPFLAPKAREAGLVDDLIYEHNASERLSQKTGIDLENFIGVRQYLASGGWQPKGNRKRVAVLIAQGDILRSAGTDFFGEEQAITPGGIARMTRGLAENRSIAGVIVRVDSPGGDAIASDEILSELKRLASSKPLVFSMSDVAASGGYYMAMTGDPVVAYPGTITGSIGVVYGKPNLKGLYDKLGISVESLERGRYAGIDSTSGPLTNDERAKLREGIDFIYQGFIRRVAEGRKKKPSEIETVAQGRVWLGSQAMRNGLVDQLGGFDKAVELLREKAKFTPDEVVLLESYPRRRSILDRLLTSADESTEAPSPGVKTLVRMAGPGVAPFLMGGMLRSMPYRLEFR